MSQIKTSKSKTQFWRSFNQLENNPQFEKFLHREFQENATEVTSDVSRREFIKLMGASALLAGAAGCSFRKPVQNIHPYASRPEDLIPGKSRYYATAHQVGETVSGLLVESYSGRPTKCEGNPMHPSNLGAASIFDQASVLNLYDPDRLARIAEDGRPKSVEDFKRWLNSFLSDGVSTAGEGVCFLIRSSLSPAFNNLLASVKSKLPKAKIFRYDPVNDDSVNQAIMKSTGQSVLLSYDFEKADRIVSFESDFLGTETDATLSAKQFSKRRDPEHVDGLNRLYVFESSFTVTGAKADHRYRASIKEVEQVILHFADLLLEMLGVNDSLALTLKAKVSQNIEPHSSIDRANLKVIVTDILEHKRSSVLTGGRALSESAQMILLGLNQLLGNLNRTITAKSLPFSHFRYLKKSSLESIKELSEAITKNSVKQLFILGGDPVYDAPKEYNFGVLLNKVNEIVHLTSRWNHTSSVSKWVIPESHYLESWGDLMSRSGVYSIVQPLISPMYESMSGIELLGLISSGSDSGYELVKGSFKTINPYASESQWKKTLHNGVSSQEVSESSINIQGYLVNQSFVPMKSNEHGLEVTFKPDFSLFDGQFANNSWLQEMPDPITKLTWDNAALISPSLAKKYHLKSGDFITIKSEENTLKLPVWIMPGQAESSITLFLGYGQTQAGRVGDGKGFDVAPLRTSSGFWVTNNVSIKKAVGTYVLASTQEHGSLEGRPHFAQATEKEYAENPEFAKELEEVPDVESLWNEVKYDKGHQWGMSIDLSKCTGCNACLVGCQAENNIPIVGKQEILNGRDMNWIRIDRYFEGDPDDPDVVQQPMTCLQCENAPCEQVCPVAATSHSKDGLNQMTYNRCIGTRYCSNNCPVKVRRFNFFDYHQRHPQAHEKERVHFFDYFKEPAKPLQKQFNPNVTVRMRGVMEKCTYCIQRIKKVTSENSVRGKSLEDGQIKTACQQTCPADAIVFGDINDPESRVSNAREKERNYTILNGLRLKPRTSYLASIVNPNPLLGTTPKKEQHHGH